MSKRNASSSRSAPERLVRSHYPNAECWWNCMEFDWIIWDGPAMVHNSRSIGSGLTKARAWADAARRLRE